MNRLPIVVTGAAMSISGLLMTAGVGLVVMSNAAEAQRRAAAEQNQQEACAAERAADLEVRTRQQSELSELRDRLRAAERETNIARRAALEARARRDIEAAEAQIRGWDAAAPRPAPAVPAAYVRATTIEELFPGAAEASEPSVEDPAVRRAVLTGDLAEIRAAVAQHNALGGEPIILHDDPELAQRGISLRARYNRGAPSFSVTLEARSQGSEPVTVLVAPGSIVKATPGYQDTAPIQARFLHVAPSSRTEQPTTICCAMIHSNDPRVTTPRGIGRHVDPRVGRVAAAAEREHAEWGPAQVAIWAVANDATPGDVAHAPGAYMAFVEPARDLLEKAGIDTNHLPLYSGASPVGRRSALGLDFSVRGGLPGGG